MRSVLQSVRTRAWVVRRAARYLIIGAIGNLVWEAIQIPLYTIWRTSTWREIFIAVTHCTGGDVLIGTVTLLIGALVARIHRWRPFGFRMMLTTVILGVAYTIFSEWLNVEVWNDWSYSAIMPVLPWSGTGLASVLQWVIVPGLAFTISGMRKGYAA